MKRGRRSFSNSRKCSSWKRRSRSGWNGKNIMILCKLTTQKVINNKMMMMISCDFNQVLIQFRLIYHNFSNGLRRLLLWGGRRTGSRRWGGTWTWKLFLQRWRQKELKSPRILPGISGDHLERKIKRAQK